MGLFSAIFFFCALLIPDFPTEGNGRFIVLGIFVYLLPLKYLYREKLSLLTAIICLSCVYTMGCLSLSIQLAGLSGAGTSLPIAAVEAVFYLFTAPVFFRKILPKYIFILDSIQSFGRHWYRYLILDSILLFLTLSFLNNLFLEREASVRQAAVLALFLVLAFTSYFILYKIILDALRMTQLEKAALRDPLTGLGNRTQLWEELQAAIDADQIFSIIFMDLDRFKQINDQFGHVVGDQYLKHFARISSRLLQGQGIVCRFGGDEFVALCSGEISPDLLQTLRECPGWEINAPCPFNQVSAGMLVCRPPHGDVEEILQQVDHLMYQSKQEKKQ